MANTAVVQEYEVFKNRRDALAFFFFRQKTLDDTSEEGPFWFSVKDDKSIVAGTEEHQAVFPGLKDDVIATAKKRGVIMLVEFENQQPVRCTPCYLSDSF